MPSFSKDRRFELIEQITIKFAEHPYLHLYEVFVILQLKNSDSIAEAFTARGINTLYDLLSLNETDWLSIDLDASTIQTIKHKLAYIEHYNRFEQQNKNYHIFLFNSTTFLLIFLIMVLFSSICLIVHLTRSDTNPFQKEFEYYPNPVSFKCPIQPPMSPGQTTAPGFCKLSIRIPDDQVFPIYIYYNLTDVFQNYRKLYGSISNQQISGQYNKTTGCEPFDKLEVTSQNSDGEDVKQNKIVYACGGFAYSYFDDVFKLSITDNQTFPAAFPDNKENIIRSIKGFNFMIFQDLMEDFLGINERNEITTNIFRMNINDKQTPYKIKASKINDPRFINWINAAVYSNFEKLYAIVDKPKNSETYNEFYLHIKILNFFETKEFKGKKTIVVKSKSTALNKNSKLIYFHVGIVFVCLLFGGVLPILDAWLKHKRKDKQKYWNKEFLDDRM
eukprot:GAHX01002157.1.p1 GENE.GAHX01002157.1~~GAHX01002157.1.p1  ORF type:complete len:446 (-),score=81.24 GAHX01002157.1:32-1369(-)